MSKELKQYRLDGLRFLHDSRGRFVRDGETAWLDDSKARKIRAALKRDGRPDALVPLKKESKKAKPEPKPVEQTKDSTATEDKGADKSFSVDEPSPVLGLHFSIRKKIAAFISGSDVETTPEADEIIKAAPADVVALAQEAIETDEA